MNPGPVITYECHACGQTFTSELGRRAHDAVCIPRNMPGQSDAPFRQSQVNIQLFHISNLQQILFQSNIRVKD